VSVKTLLLLLDDCLKKSTLQLAGIHHYNLSNLALKVLYNIFANTLLSLVLLQAPVNEQRHVSNKPLALVQKIPLDYPERNDYTVFCIQNTVFNLESQAFGSSFSTSSD
jgi:hypothetical protein